MTHDIHAAQEAGVMTLRFNRTAKKNAITRAMYSALAEGLERADGDNSVRVVVIAGAPGVFTAGNDLIDFMEAPPHIGGAETPPVERFMRALMGCGKPVIAAVDGLAIGIGVTLLLHCDLAYASDRSVFRTPFVDLALVPEFGSSVLLPGLAGRAVASELLMLGESWDAGRAAQAGLINAVHGADDLEREVMARAHALAAKAPEALRQTKALITAGQDGLMAVIRTEGEVFARQLASAEFSEAVNAFLERRAPDFSKTG